MNKIIFPLMVMTLVSSCSSQPKSHADIENDAVVEHIAKGKKLLGKDFDARFEKDGIINGEYVAIASVKGNINDNDKQLLTLAASDAKAKLFESAPQEFKKVVQSAFSSSSGDNGSVDSVSISVNEVQALTGVMSNFNDSQCVTYAIPNSDMKYTYEKECRVIYRVPGSNLLKAYKFTLDKKYGVKEENAIKDILRKQLSEKVLDNESKKVN